VNKKRKKKASLIIQTIYKQGKSILKPLFLTLGCKTLRAFKRASVGPTGQGPGQRSGKWLGQFLPGQVAGQTGPDVADRKNNR